MKDESKQKAATHRISTYLPEIIPNKTEIVPQDGLPAVTRDDLQHIHLMLTKLHQQWKMPLDIDETCKLSVVTLKVLEARRKMMLLPTEAPKQIQGTNVFFSPYEDES